MSVQSQPITPFPFIWWYDEQASFTLATCASIDFHISTQNSSVTATPPYTMIATPRGGLPRVYNAGDGTAAFSWDVPFSIGTQVLLSFVDAQGYSGGTGPLLTVVAGSANNCVSSPMGNGVTLALNPASDPTLCAPVRLAAAGGQAPYTFTIQKAGYTAINISNADSSAIWVNDMQAGATFIVAASDATGAYAVASDLIFSQGGSNTSCLTAGSSNSTGSTSNHGTPIGLIGGAAAGGILILLAAVVGFFFWRRRRAQQDDHTSSNRNSFISSGRRTHQKLPSASSVEKLNAFSNPSSSAFPSRFGSDEASVHSLQALHPVQFRVVNPDDEGNDFASIRAPSTAGSAAGLSSSRQTYTTQRGEAWTAQATSYNPQQAQNSSTPNRRSSGGQWAQSGSEPQQYHQANPYARTDYGPPSPEDYSPTVSRNPSVASQWSTSVGSTEYHSNRRSLLSDRRLPYVEDEEGSPFEVEVVQHSDGGRVLEEAPPRRVELPPAYPASDTSDEFRQFYAMGSEKH